ncbi:MAG: hypothetical protein ACPGGA_07220 [Balneolaceae bacterium]
MKTWLFRASIFFLLIAFSPALAHSQDRTQEPIRITVSPDKGVHFESADGFMEFRMGFRLQQQLALTQIVSEEDALQGEYVIRRERVIFRGFLFHNKLDFLVQFGMDRGKPALLNAEYRWKPDTYTQISFGQFFPPTFRQFQTASQNFQMVDRSNVSRFFFTDYDLGIRVRRTLPVSDNFQFKISGALTHGEGKNIATAPGGWAYMGRIELLPFGAFERGGDYVEGDVFREKTPKLSLGTGFYTNHDAYTKYGDVVWDGEDDDINDAYADLIFKYNGFSFLAEYIHRNVDNELLLMDGELYSSHKISGEGFYLQSGKFISNHIEITSRFSYLNPDDIHHTELGKFTDQRKFALGFNYFFIGHSLKLQSQLGYVSEQFAAIKTCNYFEVLTQFTISF